MDNQEENDSIDSDLFAFPRTVNRKAWTEYLGRDLTSKEDSIIECFCIERSFNKKMEKLYEMCKKKNLRLTGLTGLYGDCMFESLNYHGIGTSVKNLRLGLAHIMNIYKDYKNFFPSQEATLKELFSMFNEVQLVSCNNNKKLKSFHFYTYETMLKDLSNKKSWTLLPTQLILMVISLVYKAEIKIVNNETEYETIINVYQELDNPPKLKKVIIGQLGESHYLPLDNLGDFEFQHIFYTEEREKFVKWAKYMEHLKYTEYKKKLTKKSKNCKSQTFNDFKELKNKKKSKINLVNFE